MKRLKPQERPKRLNYKTSLFIVVIFALILTNCFGPFYRTLITKFETQKGKWYDQHFGGYNIEIICESMKIGNKQGVDTFLFVIQIQSESKIKSDVALDTINTFINDSLICLDYSTRFSDSSYYVFWHSDENRIVHEPIEGYGPVTLDKLIDSIEIIYTATLYDDTTYNRILDKQEFSGVLYRRYQKAGIIIE